MVSYRIANFAWYRVNPTGFFITWGSQPTLALALILTSLLAFNGPVQAAANTDAYVGRVPAVEADEGGLTAGYQAALIQVLKKLSGSVAQVDTLAQAEQLGSVSPLVMVHRFVGPELGETQQRWLEVQFDNTLTNDRVRDLGLPVWPLERPETLVWVAVQREGQRVLLGLAEEDSTTVAGMAVAAREAGIPLVLPLLDLNDQREVRVSDVWGGFAANLAAASTRYGVRQTLLGRSYSDRGGWTTRWLLSGLEGSRRWESSGQTLRDSLAAGITTLAATIAESSVIVADEVSGRVLRVRIRGLDGADDYGRLARYLENLSVVERFEPVSVLGNTLDLNLVSNVGLRGFQQVLSTGQLLRPGARNSGIADLELEFQRQ